MSGKKLNPTLEKILPEGNDLSTKFGNTARDIILEKRLQKETERSEKEELLLNQRIDDIISVPIFPSDQSKNYTLRYIDGNLT